MKIDENTIHHCADIPASGVSIRLNEDYLDRPNPVWCLFIERYATEDDLQQNHHLEDVGETIWTTLVEISFCPYCGQKLVPATAGELPADLGRFAHIDASGWASRWD